MAERPLVEWSAIIDRVAASDFCNGRIPGREWVANFDWLVRPETAIKVMEGMYDNRAAAPKAVPFHIAGSKRQEPWEAECGELHNFDCAGPTEHAQRMAARATA